MHIVDITMIIITIEWVSALTGKIPNSKVDLLVSSCSTWSLIYPFENI